MEREQVAAGFVVQLGRYLQHRRESIGLSRDELALLAGIEIEWLICFEEGALQCSPGVSLLERLAIVFEVTPARFLEDFKAWQQINGT